MNIAYLSSSTIPSVAANSVHVMFMCEAISAAGYDVTLYARFKRGFSVQQIFEQYGITRSFNVRNVYRCDLPVIGGIVTAVANFRLKHELRRFRAIYARDPFLLNLVRDSSVSQILELHGISKDPVKRWIVSRLLTQGRVHRIVVISDALQRVLLRRYRNHDLIRKIVVAHDAARVVVEPFDSKQPATAQSAPPAPTNTDTFTVGYAGAFLRGKGVERILRIASDLPDVSFRMVGGSLEQVQRLTNIAIVENVSIEGRIGASEVPSFLQSCQALIAPFEREVKALGGNRIDAFMSPLKIFEYMAAKCPIVASDLPVLREVLEHDRNCLLVPPDRDDLWVYAINRLKRDQKLAEAIAENAYSDFLEHYTWDARAQKVLQGLDSVSF